MPWGRIDDAHYRHRKVAELEEDRRKGCLALYWLAISWCNDQLTDGRVTMTTVRMLGGDPSEAEELVRVGLWDRDGNAFRVHDFLDFNKSREQVEQERAQRSAAGAAGAAKRWGDGESYSTSLSESYSTSSSEMHGDMHGGKDAPSPVSRTPVTPVPEPIARDGLPHLDQQAIAFLEGLTGRSVSRAGPKQLTEYDRQIERHGFDAVVRAYRKVAKALPPQPEARQLVWSGMKVLEPMVTPQDIKRLESQEREDDEARAHRLRLEATRRRIEELKGTA